MQYTLIFTTLLSLTSAAAVSINERSPIHPIALTGRAPAKLVARAVCGPLQTPLCCETDVDGVADLTCENAVDVSTTAEFEATCAATGLTAECCVLPVGTDGLLCTAA